MIEKNKEILDFFQANNEINEKLDLWSLFDL